jgi:hypothetical protein
MRNVIAAALLLLAIATLTVPRFVLSMGIACLVLSLIAFVGAWLVDRYAPLPLARLA